MAKTKPKVDFFLKNSIFWAHFVLQIVPKYAIFEQKIDFQVTVRLNFFFKLLQKNRFKFLEKQIFS